ncbi:MAG TPA: hypothetical protein DDZ51_12100, partial [Planctomycetaceae bacterium]|nr:hypothetical protein [Planctomycetaceae bacterium]
IDEYANPASDPDKATNQVLSPLADACDSDKTGERNDREAAIKNAQQKQSSAEAAAKIESLKQQINRLQRAVRLAIESELADWTGRTYGSLVANQDVVRMIHEMIDGHGLRLKCPECGHPAILRCSSRPGIADGVFVFDHQVDGRRTFHGGGVVLPTLRLIAKPPRRRKADRS